MHLNLLFRLQMADGESQALLRYDLPHYEAGPKQLRGPVCRASFLFNFCVTKLELWP